MVQAILPVNKPVGMTSYDVIRQLKPLLPRRYKIGHAGTLDPFAEGLLLILIGRQATKKMSTILRLPKDYEVTCVFGFETDTQDITGEIVKRADSLNIDKSEISFALEKFRGKIMQIPPAYSAKKVGGKRAYELAREGIDVKLDPKEVEIYDSTLLKLVGAEATIYYKVSSGTYIRTLVTDLGRELGCFATAKKLIRTSIGSYDLSQAINFSDLEDITDISEVDNLIHV